MFPVVLVVLTCQSSHYLENEMSAVYQISYIINKTREIPDNFREVCFAIEELARKLHFFEKIENQLSFLSRVKP